MVAVLGTVACAAGPKAADRGVAGKGTETGLAPLMATLDGSAVPFIICFQDAPDMLLADDGPGTGGTGPMGGGKGLRIGWVLIWDEAEVGYGDMVPLIPLEYPLPFMVPFKDCPPWNPFGGGIVAVALSVKYLHGLLSINRPASRLAFWTGRNMVMSSCESSRRDLAMRISVRSSMKLIKKFLHSSQREGSFRPLTAAMLFTFESFNRMLTKRT